jgi:hypothetical protein
VVLPPPSTYKVPWAYSQGNARLPWACLAYSWALNLLQQANMLVQALTWPFRVKRICIKIAFGLPKAEKHYKKGVNSNTLKKDKNQRQKRG